MRLPIGYQHKQLFIENYSAKQLVKDYGSPLYVYSGEAIESAWHKYADALGKDDLVCYAVKANSNLGVLSLLARLGSGFDIVSLGELERVLAAGGSADRIVFSGVGKQAFEMQRALEAGVYCFNVESESELEQLNEVAAGLGKKAPVSLRVNPDVDAGTHPYISTGLKQNKFGIDIMLAPEVYQRAAAMSHIDIKGVDCHIGSQITELSPFLDAVKRLLVLVDQLASVGIVLSHLDLGGGIGIAYKDDEKTPDLHEYVLRVRELIGDRRLNLIMEPGRSIVGQSGVFLTSVLYLKKTEYHQFAIVDGAMNDLIRPALYQAWQRVLTVDESPAGDEGKWDVVGPICETGDFLAHDRQLCLSPGQILAVMDSGAYGFTMSSNYNSRNRVAEILVSKGDAHLVRKRETIENQIALESVLPAKQG